MFTLKIKHVRDLSKETIPNQKAPALKKGTGARARLEEMYALGK
jgi:hypothetical protein